MPLNFQKNYCRSWNNNFVGNLLNVPILDLFTVILKIEMIFIDTKMLFTNGKPNDINYKFLIPNKNLNKTINKMLFYIKNEKIN